MLLHIGSLKPTASVLSSFECATTDATPVVSQVITKLATTLQQKLPEFASHPQQHWRKIEGFIYCLRQSISTNDPTFFDAPVVGELLQLLPTLPAVGQLQATAIRTVGTYSNWLSKNEHLLPPMLTFVSNGLANEGTAAAASQAMRHLCDSCAEHLAGEQTMRQLLQMYLGTLQLQLTSADRVDLIAALAFVISQMKFVHIFPAMQAIAQPLVNRMTTILHRTDSSAAEIAIGLEQLCALLRGVAPSRSALEEQAAASVDHPCVQMLQGCWEVLEAIFRRHGSSSNCMEKLCRCYKHTARNCGEGFRAVVHRLIPQVSTWQSISLSGIPHSHQPRSCDPCCGCR